MKTIIQFSDQQIPVYIIDNKGKKPNNKLIDTLVDILDRKIKTGKRTVKKFLDTLDSIEIVGSDAILYSKKWTDTLALSLF
ncbi:hypothetical protein J31TS4_02410 [Paenibacillus sp. J31TS4]|uniref:hypothetical protein n=1 Tax=Paenibacillus sp. J31TS4 TaxID=2807195 RepID=UPI001B1EFEE4|nr:hypothetical protein [Paenibacillus sp. J31TS4]GIP36961.1 hypothetical protein J31TS4_02410 [Paenibacillus sp. J31TS4]